MGPATKLTLKPLHNTFVAEVEGVNWKEPIPKDVIDQIQEAIDKYGVLVFRAANIDNETQVNFMKNFGQLDKMPFIRIRGRFPDQPHIFDVSNLDEQGNIVQHTDRVLSMMNKGNQLWHADMQYHPRRDKYSLLRAVEIPPRGCGGETEFADSRSAYEALPQETKDLLDNMVCNCSLLHNRRQAAPSLYQGVDPLDWSISRWKAVYPHPSGRKNLYMTSYAYKIDGHSVQDSKKIVDQMIEHATQPQFVYKVLWEQAGDMVMWDNTAVWHRALDDSAYKYKYRRDMRRTNTFDDGEFAWGENEVGNAWHVKMPTDPLAHENTQEAATDAKEEDKDILQTPHQVPQPA